MGGSREKVKELLDSKVALDTTTFRSVAIFILVHQVKPDEKHLTINERHTLTKKSFAEV